MRRNSLRNLVPPQASFSESGEQRTVVRGTGNGRAGRGAWYLVQHFLNTNFPENAKGIHLLFYHQPVRTEFLGPVGFH